MPAGGDLNRSPFSRRPWAFFSGVERLPCTLFGVLADTNDSDDAHRINNPAQMFVTGLEHGFNQRFRNLVGRDVLPSLTKQE